MEKETIKNLIDVLGLVKDLKRTGWVMYGVDGAESDAEHSFGVAMLAMMLAPKEIDKLKCLELALVHDMADIIKRSKISCINFSHIVYQSKL